MAVERRQADAPARRRPALAGFVKKLPSRYRIALITFSNDIAVKVPPTYDRDSVIKALPKKTQLEGTAIGDALSQAVERREEGGRAEQAGPAPPAGDDPARLGRRPERRAGHAGAGCAAGAEGRDPGLDRLARHGRRQGGPEDPASQGKTFPLVTQVPVEPKTLRSVATASGGHFYAAHSATQLGAVYKDLGHHLVYAKQFREVTAASRSSRSSLILAGAALSVVWFRRLV